ncbi:cellulase family glycosylhydrolase [Catenulispora pinisilvae]|uniref:cellulase family glycosylhydrolase n=1 Tax=Catenulispora pinisilvae TaxID=2705253 RepID=UPI001890F1A0|nr:cellulase family glycosylhydrolase [Catenulispora pinisilvae]
MANSKRRHWTFVGAAAAAIVLAAGIATAVSGGDPGEPKAFGNPPSAAATATATDTSGATTTPGAGQSSAPGTAAGTGPAASDTKTLSPADLKWGLDYSDTLTFDTPDQLNTALDDAKRLGMDYIRVDFGWEDYQSFANYPPDFSKFDNVVAGANARGLKVLATIDFPPPWARRASCKDTAACPPADNAVFANFVKQAVARYSARGVHYWEVWNEPNITAWAPLPDPADYTKLLVTVSAAIRAADPHAFILMGGLAADHPSPGAPFIAPYDFITAVAKAGGLKAVDGIGYHPYPDGDPATSSTFLAISQSPKSIITALNQAGAPNMPIWITETGANIPALIFGPPDQVKPQEAQQVQQAKREVDVLSSYPNVASFFWFSYQDSPPDRLFFGLRRGDGTYRPAFDTLQQIIADAKKAQ